MTADTQPIPRPGILDVAPYVGGEPKAEGVARVIRLASNESALGPSPRAIAAYEARAREIHRYPDGGSTELRAVLARHHGLDADRIVCGSGSDELISLLVRAYVGPGDEVVYSRHGFLMYPIAAKTAGATPVAAPEKNLTTDIDALLAAVTKKTKIVFLANPNNPTGTYTSADDVARLHASLPPSVLLVIDAACAECRCRLRASPVVRNPDAQDGRLSPARMAAHHHRDRARDARRHRRVAQIPRIMTVLAFERVALIGIGLIGSSLARVLRRDRLAGEIVACARNPATRDKALELGLADRATEDAAEAVRHADLVVLATPLSAYAAIGARISPALRPGAPVTHVGSVKQAVIPALQTRLPARGHFIPGHPVAGTEHSGPESGFAELFRDR